MKNSFVNQKLTAFAVAVLLCCSVLFIQTNAHAQCANCSYVTLSETGGMDLTCPCNVNTCNGNTCTSSSTNGGYIWLSGSASCCIDSIVITPAPGVCWQGCMGTFSGGNPIYWAVTGNNEGACHSGFGSFIGSALLGYLCPGDTLYFHFCTSNSGSISGFMFTFYWSDGTSCVLSAP